MKTERNIVVEGPGRVAVRDEPRAPVPAGGFRVTTVFSGVSAGTELSYVKGTNPFLAERWDPDLGLFVPGEPNAGYPVTRLGYMEVGTVAESRTPAVPVGRTVAMTYGHRTGYTGDPVSDRVIFLPEDLHPLLGIYVAHMGPICANGLLHAAAELSGPDVRSLGDGVRGRRVVVVGAGVVGLLTALLARRHGAASVVVLDPTPGRRAVAGALGLEALDPQEPDDAATGLKTRWRHAPGDRGADVVFQCRGQPAALHLALRVARPQATVIDLGFYQAGAAGLRLGAEFHHNALAVRCAQIGRVPRGLAHSWDRERLSAETIGLLRADGTAIREHLITAVVPFGDAPELFASLAAGRRHELQAVLAFDPQRYRRQRSARYVSGYRVRRWAAELTSRRAGPMIREELRRLFTWEERHRRLAARLLIALGLTLMVLAVGSVLIWVFESGVKGGDIHGYGDAAFFTAVQLLTISSAITNPLTAGGKIVDVALEMWAIFVVTSIAGSFASFFSSGDSS